MNKDDEHPIYLDIHIDSLHVGHKTGLYYNGANYDHKPNKVQKWSWKVWEKFWGYVESVKKEYKASYIHLSMLGEAGDIDFKQRSGQFWTKNYLESKRNACDVLHEPMQMIDSAHFFKGTDAHVGDGATLDEMVAENFDQVIRTDEGGFAHARADYKIADVLFNSQHYGKNRSKWGENNMIEALKSEILIERGKNKLPVPDVSTRGHFHWFGATTEHRWPLVVQVPSWQLPYPYIYSIDAVGKTAEVGGAIFVCQGDKVKLLPKYYTYPRSKTWQTPK